MQTAQIGAAVVVAALLAAGLFAAPAAADWLVTRDGGRVETKGPWKVKGKLVVFTRAAETAASSWSTRTMRAR